MAKKVIVPEKLRQVSLQKFDEMEKEIKKSITDKEAMSRITEKFDEFMGTLSEIEEYKNKMSYKGGMEHYAKLKREMQEIITSKFLL